MLPFDSSVLLSLNATAASPDWRIELALFCTQQLPAWLIAGAVGAFLIDDQNARAHISSAFVDMAPDRSGRGRSIDAPSDIDRKWNGRLLMVVAIFATLWMAATWLTTFTPPADTIEQMSWSRSLQWGYFKHPPLTTWLYWAAQQLIGPGIWPGYLLATLVNLGSMMILWQLIRQFRGATFAYVCVLAVLCITYYNGRLTLYNHNTLLTLLSTASAALCWKAMASRQWHWWAALGLIMGMGALTKYEFAITVMSVIVFWLSQRGWRDAANRAGLLVSILICLLMFVPHLYWLQSHDFGPIAYALRSSLGAELSTTGRMADAANWLADQLVNRSLPAWLLLLAVALCHRCGDVQAESVNKRLDRRRSNLPARALIFSWALVPMVFIPAMGLVTGAQLQLPWATAYLLFIVPAAMMVWQPKHGWNAVSLKLTTQLFFSIQFALLLLSLLTSTLGPKKMRDQHWRSLDSAHLAQALLPNLERALGCDRLAAIEGPGDLAGALALHLPGRPPVWIDGRLDRSPWLTTAIVSSGPILHVGFDVGADGGTAVPGFQPAVWWRISRSPASIARPKNSESGDCTTKSRSP